MRGFLVDVSEGEIYRVGGCGRRRRTAEWDDNQIKKNWGEVTHVPEAEFSLCSN